MSKKIIQRNVLITEKDFPKLRREALVKSRYGNKKLYDTCEWTPFNKDSILFYSMLHGDSYSRFLKQKFHWYKDDQRSGWVINYDEEVDCVIINPSGNTRHGYYRWEHRNVKMDQKLGLATLVKEKE